MVGSAARRVAVTLAVVVVAAGLAALVTYRVAYGTVAFWDEPVRISWCDRNYRHGDREVTRATLIDGKQHPPVPVMKVPPLVGAPVLAAPSGDSCPTVLYLQTSPDTYRAYALSGGP